MLLERWIAKAPGKRDGAVVMIASHGLIMIHLSEMCTKVNCLQLCSAAGEVLVLVYIFAGHEYKAAALHMFIDARSWPS